MRERLRDFADLATLAQGLIALSSAGILAVILQALAEAFFGLSVIERILLGVCLFLVLLAVFLSRVKIFRERRASRKSELERLSADLEKTQREYDQLSGELREAEREREELRVQRDALKNDLAETRPHGQATEGDIPEETIAIIEQMKAKIEQLEAENDWLQNQPGDQELKQCSLRLGFDPLPRTDQS